MVKSIYKGNLEVGTLYKGSSRIYRTSNVPQIITPYQGFPESVLGTSASDNVFNGYWADHRTDFIISSTELEGLGMRNGSVILGMSFKNRTSNATTPNFKLALKHTTQTVSPSVFDSYYTFQEVYSNSNLPALPDDVYYLLNFTTPFVWDGSSNLMVSISSDRLDDVKDNNKNVIRANVSTDYTTTTYFSDNGTFPFETGSRSQKKYIPSIQLNVLGLGLNKSLLSAFIAKSEIVFTKKANYSIGSVANLQTAYNEAVLLFNNDNVTQEQVDAAVKRFESVYSALVSLVVLKKAIRIESDYPENIYTVESYTNFKTAIQNAKDALLIPDITPEAVDDYESAIWIARNSLEYIPFPGGKLTSTPSAIVSDGLMGYWDTGGRTNESDSITSLPDISGNAWDMNLIGLNGDVLSGFLGGYGLKVDTVNDWAQTPENRSITGSTGFTTDVVVKLDDDDDANKLVFGTGISNQYEAYTIDGLESRTNPAPGYTFTSANAYYRRNDEFVAFATNTISNYKIPLKSLHLTHVMEKVNNSFSYKMYVNGLLVSSKSGPISIDEPPYFELEGQLSFVGLGYGFDTIYSARCYNKALTAAEVAQNYNYEKTRWGLD